MFAIPVPTPRRFTASAARWKRMGVIFYVTMIVWFAAVAGSIGAVGTLLGAAAAKNATGVVIVASLVGYGFFLVYALKPRPLLVDLWPDYIALDEGRRGVFPLARVRLGAWQLPVYGVVAGTALHLDDGTRSFCLGGRDHRPHATLRLDTQSVETVDAYVTAAEFDALLSALPIAAHDPEYGQVYAPPAVVRCTLTPNPSSARGALSTMAPWIIALVVNCLLGAFAGTLDIGSNMLAQEIFGAVGALIMVVALVVTIVRASRRRTPALAIELGPQELRLVDVKTGTIVTTTSLAFVQCLPAQHTYSGRMTYTMPMLVMTLPGTKPITMGIPDYRFAWMGEVRSVSAARYVVGGADWLTLVERFGLRQHLRVGEG